MALDSTSPGIFTGRSAFSPDGKWLAYQASEANGTNIFVQPFPVTGTKYQITRIGNNHHPLWSPDGKELFFFPGPSSGLQKVAVTTKGGFAFGNPVEAFPRQPFYDSGPPGMRSYDITPDGKYFLSLILGTQSGAPVSPPIRVVLNWFTELQQRVPR